MPEFLAEQYMSKADAASAGGRVERARLAAVECSGEGMAVRHLQSIFVPEDETCFYLYEAQQRRRRPRRRAASGNAVRANHRGGESAA